MGLDKKIIHTIAAGVVAAGVGGETAHAARSFEGTVMTEKENVARIIDDAFRELHENKKDISLVSLGQFFNQTAEGAAGFNAEKLLKRTITDVLDGLLFESPLIRTKISALRHPVFVQRVHEDFMVQLAEFGVAFEDEVLSEQITYFLNKIVAQATPASME